jgi:hypothetical protein
LGGGQEGDGDSTASSGDGVGVVRGVGGSIGEFDVLVHNDDQRRFGRLGVHRREPRRVSSAFSEAGIRETKDETGIDCEITGIVGVYTTLNKCSITQATTRSARN